MIADIITRIDWYTLAATVFSTIILAIIANLLTPRAQLYVSRYFSFMALQRAKKYENLLDEIEFFTSNQGALVAQVLRLLLICSITMIMIVVYKLILPSLESGVSDKVPSHVSFWIIGKNSIITVVNDILMVSMLFIAVIRANKYMNMLRYVYLSYRGSGHVEDIKKEIGRLRDKAKS